MSSQSPPILISRYPGSDPESSLNMFAADAPRAAASGYQPISQTWEGTTLLVTYRYEVATGSEIRAAPIAIVVAGVLIAVGSVLPWVTASSGFGITMSRSGIELWDGLVTIVLGIGIAIAGVTMLRGRNTRTSWLTLLASAIVLAIAGVDFASIQERIREIEDVIGEVGIGLYVTGVGAAIGAVASLGHALSPR